MPGTFTQPDHQTFCACAALEVNWLGPTTIRGQWSKSVVYWAPSWPFVIIMCST